MVNKRKIMIGVIYLLPSQGYPECPGFKKAYEHAFNQVKILADLGFDGALLENENDRPYKIKVDLQVINFTLRICQKLREAFPQFNLGIEFLINDPEASLLVAKESNFNFIRTDYFVDEMFREEYGILQVDLEGFKEYRQKIRAQDILVYTDLQVKYAKMIKPRPLSVSAQLAQLNQSDGVIISSHQTGVAPDLSDLKEVFKSNLSIPILIGSGFSAQGSEEFLAYADGAFIGQALMVDGVIDRDKSEQLIKVVRS